MSMGTMTVMSYDIWKAKCAAEKKEREEKEKEEKERKASLPARSVTPEAIPRKRAHTFVSMVILSSLFLRDLLKAVLNT